MQTVLQALDARHPDRGLHVRADEFDSVAFNVIAPGYSATLDTPIVLGREFDDRETGTSPKVGIVNESFARHFSETRRRSGGTSRPSM